jgi:hypothetical protein
MTGDQNPLTTTRTYFERLIPLQIAFYQSSTRLIGKALTEAPSGSVGHRAPAGRITGVMILFVPHRLSTIVVP